MGHLIEGQDRHRPAQSAVRVFIGSGEASRLERKVLIHTLRNHVGRPLEIFVFNGTHNAVEPPAGEPFAAPMSLRAKYRNTTEFSLYRFLIPQLCGFDGRAVYLDSDIVCLDDIGGLFDLPLDGHDFLARRDAYPGRGADRWALSVLSIDGGACRFDLERYCVGSA